MERTSGSREKRTFLHSRVLCCVLLAGLFASTLAILFGVSALSSAPAFAATLLPSLNTFAVSPTQGPVGAVISVSGNGVVFPDDTQVKLGYTIDLKTCNLVSDSQAGTVQTGAFSGWFRWPASTPVGTFGVCAIANNLTFQVGSYQVLSTSEPQVSVAPTKLIAGQQATVSGANFLPGGTSVNLVWRSANGGHRVSLGTVSSNQTGTFAHTFTVPAHASSGSYTLTGTVGSSSLPVLSAATTFHVDGVTLVVVPISTAAPHATAAPTVAPTTVSATVTSQTVSTHQSVNTNSGDLGNKASLFVPIALGGGLLIALALGAGVLVVRKQRRLIAGAPGSISGPLLWPQVPDMIAGGVNVGAGSFTPWPEPIYQGGQAPLTNPGSEYAPSPGPTLPNAAWNKAVVIPFDPGLAEAMREAQMSLFATPRPPVSAEVEIQ